MTELTFSEAIINEYLFKIFGEFNSNDFSFYKKNFKNVYFCIKKYEFYSDKGLIEFYFKFSMMNELHIQVSTKSFSCFAYYMQNMQKKNNQMIELFFLIN